MDINFADLATNSVFLVLFVWLLKFVIDTNKEREVKYQEIISNLSEGVIKEVDKLNNKIDNVEGDIADIKNMVGGVLDVGKGDEINRG